MKSRTKNVIKLIISFLLIICCLEVYSRTLSYDDYSDIRPLYRFKYLDENSLDVICIGSSGPITSISPNYAWKLAGLTSYNYGSLALPFSMYKYLLQETQKTQKPKLYIVDLETICADNSNILSLESTQRVFDALPFSLEKVITAINMYGSDSDRFLFYSLRDNHYNYLHLLYNAYMPIEDQKDTELLYGSKLLNKTITSGDNYIYGTDESVKELIDSLANDYLIEFLEYCTNKDINVLFILTPHLFLDEEDGLSVYNKVNYCKDIINEYGYDLINYSTNVEELGFDLDIDFNDYQHLNARGQKKFTEILTKEILSRINVEEKKENIINKWNNNYLYYDKKYQEIESTIQSSSHN